MEEFSRIAPDGREAVVIDIPPHWADHRFQGRAVLPAVEAMQLLADRVLRFRREAGVSYMGEAAFDKFLELPPTGGRIEAWCEMEEVADGGLRTALLTRTPSKSGGMIRTKVHTNLVFYPTVKLSDVPDLDLASALKGVCFSVEPQRIYEELVPFGPGFRSICEPLRLTEEGALAVIRAPERADARTDLPLGSPFVLDGAFHAACVWSQRFTGVVAFPVGFEQRIIASPARHGESYISRIFPVRTDPSLLTFDIWIMDKEGRLCEKLKGVRMRDVSGGKLHPPDWVRSRWPAESLERIAGKRAAIVLIDRASLMPFADRCLAEAERRRTLKMRPKRLTDYLLARLVCKRLVRQLSGNNRITPAREILTVDADGVRPCCPVTNGRSYYCSVSHNRRFAVAVASEKPIGLDVETLDDRLLKNLHLFLDAGEQDAVRGSGLGPVGAAVRAWTTKEAVAKMLNIDLADAWARTRLLTIEDEQSLISITDGPPAAVVHQCVEDNLITLVHTV